jgi:Kef-type K+ transport system membrane component KefB
VPSVILLIGSGIGLRYAFGANDLDIESINFLVELFGNAGLIVIILEASLDLKLEVRKKRLIRSSFLSAIFILVVSLVAIALAVYYFLAVPFRTALVYGLPLSVISSAIVIPSVEHLSESKKEFIAYESSLSDIFGVLFFNYLILDELFSIASYLNFFLSIIIILLISTVSTFLLIYLVSKLGTHLKLFLLIAILFLLYAIGKLYHFPSLLIIMIFGLTLSNLRLLIHPKTEWIINLDTLTPIINQFRSLTSEFSFLIRTFFFLFFGFTIDVASLVNPEVILLGSIILFALLGIRYLYFRFIIKTEIFPEIFLMPRGLITILLFYSIPAQFHIPYFDKGVLFFVVIGTSLLMSLGLILFKPKAVTITDLDQNV